MERSWLCLTSFALRLILPPTLVLLLKTLVKHVFSRLETQVHALITLSKSYMRIAKVAKISACYGQFLCVGIFNGFSRRINALQKQSSFTIILRFYTGDSAEVCQSKGEEFSCPTAETSINATCDKARCPLQGPSMAPIIESQLSTG